MRAKQPNSRHCFVCGVENQYGLSLKFYETDHGEVTAQTMLPRYYQGYPGIAHGGVVAAMLDEAAGRSLMGSMDQPRFMFTATLNVRYRKNVPVEQPIRLIGKAGTIKRRTAEGTSTIYNEAGELLAEASVLLVNLPEETVRSVDLEALGWKVYPDDMDQG